MPLLDHFHPPVAPRRHWESFYVDWAGAIADAYRPIVRDQQERTEMWQVPLEIGQPLPVLPLTLDAEQVLPVDLEATYMLARQRRRLA
jgi:hypothetical protein